MVKIENFEDLKSKLELATLVDKALPPTAKLGAKAIWPEFLRNPEETGFLLKDAPKFEPTADDFKLWEEVSLNWIKFFSEQEKREEWAVVWLKAGHMPNKVIAAKLKMSRTKVWYCYERGMSKLYAKLTGNAAPAGVKKHRKKDKIVGFCRDICSIKQAIERLEKRMKNNY